MEMKTSSLIIVAIVLAVIAAVLLQISKIGSQHRLTVITSFADCVAAGNPVMESYPEQCRTQDGRLFVNTTQTNQPVPTGGADTPNPSGTMPTNNVSADCVIGGCSGEICSDASDGPMVSNCIYKAEFQCYRGVRCEKQSNGKCGWTQTAELRACLANPPQGAADHPEVY